MGSPSDPIKQAKQTIRKSWLESYPKILSDRTRLSYQICELITSQKTFQNASQIALFAGLAHEVDLFPLFRLTGRSFFFPRVDIKNKHLQFFEVTSPEDLVASSWGILEPPQSLPPIINWTERDLILVPGFAFDSQGNRIGTGGGYYDRFFSQTPFPQRWGVCFQEQYHQAELAHTHHDVRMEAIVTEGGITPSKKGK